MSNSESRRQSCAWLLTVLLAAGCAGPKATLKGAAAPAAVPSAATTSADGPPPAETTADVRTESAAAPAESAEERARLLAVRDTQGGAGLLAELERRPSDAGRAFALQTRVFDLVRDLNDPGAADALAAFLAQKQHPYFETRAATALAALSDLRAVPFLARRLRLDPLTVYGEAEWEQPLKRDDSERVVCARLLADLATLHPEARASILAQAEDAIWFWLQEQPSPHANGLRALANLESRRHITKLREWSDPQLPLPLEDALPPMNEEWAIAQSALRYVGKLRDPDSAPVLLQALQRRPANVDVTMGALSSGGATLLGMSLRALGVGAADGLSEWGDRTAFQALVNHIEDPRNNEQSQLSAGVALGWVGNDKDLQELAKRASHGVPTGRRAAAQRACYLEGLRARPVPGVATLLMPLLDRQQSPELRLAASRAIGRNRLDAATEVKLLALLRRPELKTAAALALLLGGSSKAAVAAVQSYKNPSAPALGELSQAWFQAVGAPLSTEDVANGTLFRYIENADAVAKVQLDKAPQAWAREYLGKQLQTLVYDNGPHTVTRVVLDDQLRRVAAGGDQRLASLAIRAFTLLGENGHLLDFSRATGATAEAARAAYRESLAATTP